MAEAIVVHLASTSAIKKAALQEALGTLYPDTPFEFLFFNPAAGGPEHAVNAQPVGREQTIGSARRRLAAMKLETGRGHLNVAIESGAIDGKDVAVALLENREGSCETFLSAGIPFPHIESEGAVKTALDLAGQGGFRTTTAGDIIHEKWPAIPADDWQSHFPPFLSRREQISQALISQKTLLDRLIQPMLSHQGRVLG